MKISSLEEPATITARNLLGDILIRKTSSGMTSGRIIETEAYTEDDPASHSYNGPTERSSVMFGKPGYWYVYKCYGIHWMLNIVCAKQNNGEAVLIRAIEPVDGEDLMEERRGIAGPDLTNGPGKLTEAMAVDERFNGKVVNTGKLRLMRESHERITYESPRVGIQDATDRYWRFYLKSNYLSKVAQNDLGRRRN